MVDPASEGNEQAIRSQRDLNTYAISGNPSLAPHFGIPIEDIKADLATALRLLRAVEWIYDGEYGASYCSWCDGAEVEGHEPDCELKRFLAAHPEADDVLSS